MTEKVVYFVSDAYVFKKERDGIKPNTARFTDDWKAQRWDDAIVATHIQITSNDGAIFKRKLTDKTFYKNLGIFSWKHE